MTAADARPAVLCVVDRPGWAHDRKTDALARELSGSYRLVKRFHADVTPDDVDSADLVLLYYSLQLDRLPQLAEALQRRRAKLLVGICSQFELDGAYREPGLAMLKSLPRAVFANNLSLVRSFEPLLGRRVFHTPNGVDTTFFAPPAAPRAGSMLAVGWAGSLTNHGADHRGVHDVIAPAVEAAGDMRLAIAAREDRWRGLAEMREFYHSIDVYVCASRSEGTPNPCLEAAASGLPIVTTRVGNMPELIEDGVNGFFADRDVGSIAEKLRILRDDPDRRRRMGAAARASAEAWDWRRQARAYDAMFREVL
jgi:glycosyltransferase involved in cell wall biosynthesis